MSSIVGVGNDQVNKTLNWKFYYLLSSLVVVGIPPIPPPTYNQIYGIYTFYCAVYRPPPHCICNMHTIKCHYIIRISIFTHILKLRKLRLNFGLESLFSICLIRKFLWYVLIICQEIIDVENLFFLIFLTEKWKRGRKRIMRSKTIMYSNILLMPWDSNNLWVRTKRKLSD